MFDQIIKSIRGFGQFTEEQLLEVTSRLKIIPVTKDDCLVKEGSLCREFYFVNKGSFKHYIIQENGHEAILNLFLENDWMFDYKSVIAQKPSETFIQAIEDSEVFELSAMDFHDLVKISDSFFKMGSVFQQAIQNQDYQHNRLSPEEKYTLLMETKPDIIRKFSLKLIASYLGMTPETLSRVRRKIIS